MIGNHMKQWQTLAIAAALSLVVATAVVNRQWWLSAGPSDEQARPSVNASNSSPGTPLPWQITVHPDGNSEALGLTLGTSTLADVRQRFGPDTQIAIIAAPGENGALEAFVDPAQAGFIMGKLVVTAELPAATLKALREHALKSEFMESTTRKYTLHPEGEAQALHSRIVSLSFIPQASLDADVILARFGQPAARLRSNTHQEHFLYPDKGLDVLLDDDGKELLQYVAPRDFESLRKPLQAASAAAVSTH
jgi:hypothetical protein